MSRDKWAGHKESVDSESANAALLFSLSYDSDDPDRKLGVSSSFTKRHNLFPPKAE